MREVFYLWLILAVVALSMDKAEGQRRDSSALPVFSQASAAPESSSGRASVFRRSRDGIAGFLAGVKNDTLILLTRDGEEKIPRQDISRIVADVERNRGKAAGCGMILGVYLGNLIVWTAENQPTAYFDAEGFSEEPKIVQLGANIIFAGAGGLLGYLVSGGTKEKEFDFSGSEEKVLGEWKRLQKFSVKEKSLKKLHLSTQIGYVFTRVSDRYETLMRNAGGNVWASHYVGPGSDEIEKASNVNILRKVQLTYSVRNIGELGSAVLWFGEPTITAYYSDNNFWGNVAQSLAATCYYIVGIYHPFRRQVNNRHILQIGLGLGAANMKFALKAYGRARSPTFSRFVVEHEVSKLAFSSIIFAEYKFYLSEGFSLGLMADYAFLPLKEEVPGIPEAGIPPQELSFGNGSVGITLGLHL